MEALGATAQALANPLDAVRLLLRQIGEDPTREGLEETPARVVKALGELTAGYAQDPAEILATQFTEACDEMVVVRDIPFFSLCEHHILPFSGKATVAYIPKGKIVGLSKIPRLVQCFAQRLQVQERLTNQITDAIAEHLGAEGAACVITASHTCMQMRGVRSHGQMTTSCLRGVFRTDPVARSEFLSLNR